MSAPTNWIPADKELPSNPRCVLATDTEGHYIAIYWWDGAGDGAPRPDESLQWVDASTGDPIDSHVTHWMELPEVPSA